MGRLLWPPVGPDFPTLVMPGEWPRLLSGGGSGPSRKETAKLFAFVSLPVPHRQRGTEGTTSGLMHYTPEHSGKKEWLTCWPVPLTEPAFRWVRGSSDSRSCGPLWNTEGHPQPQGSGSGQQPSRESHPYPPATSLKSFGAPGSQLAGVLLPRD